MRSLSLGTPRLGVDRRTGALWSLVETTKPHICHECGGGIAKGDRAWRPIRERSGIRRWMRVHEGCVIIKEDVDCLNVRFWPERRSL